jgi:23S rRNA (adenine2030-N6)-methyltransferase
MNYRHAFHAGNFADVFKHVILMELLQALKAKPTAFCYVDTHAGRGRYDLRADQAERTREYVDGVQRLTDAPTLPQPLRDYVELVRAFDVDNADGLAHYPGSPLIARALMREQDRAIVCELQEDEAAALKSALRGDSRFAVHQRDGYGALKALLPPAQKRGVVLIDPPFEAQGGEYALIQDALNHALSRWPNAVHAIWYPIKLRETIAPFHRWLYANEATRDVLVTELLLTPDNSSLRLNGCGIALVNPPWRFERALESFVPALKNLLAPGHDSSYRIDMLKTGSK